MAKDYVFDNAWDKERRRIASLEAVFDPGTRRILEGVGVSTGWRVLEIGGGGGSIARWLATVVAPDGSVLATDLDTRFLDEIEHPNVEVRRHDVTAEDLPEEEFDLIHARCLLEHLPQRTEVLKRLVTALKPGGWVVLEDVDFVPDTTTPPSLLAVSPREGASRFRKVWRAMAKLGTMVGLDGEYARRLPFELMAAGFDEVGAESRNRLVRGGTIEADFLHLSIEQVAPMFVSGGLMTQREIDRAIADMQDPDRYCMSATLVAAWGRRPGG